MSSTALTILSVLLALVIIAVLAGALIVIRAGLASSSRKLATLASRPCSSRRRWWITDIGTTPTRVSIRSRYASI